MCDVLAIPGVLVHIPKSGNTVQGEDDHASCLVLPQGFIERLEHGTRSRQYGDDGGPHNIFDSLDYEFSFVRQSSRTTVQVYLVQVHDHT
jgi:hypothetical protein